MVLQELKVQYGYGGGWRLNREYGQYGYGGDGDKNYLNSFNIFGEHSTLMSRKKHELTNH